MSENVSIETKVQFVEATIQYGLSDIRYLQKDPHLGSALKQFNLLSLRNENIRKLNDKLSEINFDKYFKLMQKAAELGYIQTDEARYLATLFHMVDSNITEQLVMNNDLEYETLWTLLVKKLLL